MPCEGAKRTLAAREQLRQIEVLNVVEGHDRRTFDGRQRDGERIVNDVRMREPGAKRSGRTAARAIAASREGTLPGAAVLDRYFCIEPLGGLGGRGGSSTR